MKSKKYTIFYLLIGITIVFLSIISYLIFLNSGDKEEIVLSEKITEINYSKINFKTIIVYKFNEKEELIVEYTKGDNYSIQLQLGFIEGTKSSTLMLDKVYRNEGKVKWLHTEKIEFNELSNRESTVVETIPVINDLMQTDELGSEKNRDFYLSEFLDGQGSQ